MLHISFFRLNSCREATTSRPTTVFGIISGRRFIPPFLRHTGSVHRANLSKNVWSKTIRKNQPLWIMVFISCLDSFDFENFESTLSHPNFHISRAQRIFFVSWWSLTKACLLCTNILIMNTHDVKFRSTYFISLSWGSSLPVRVCVYMSHKKKNNLYHIIYSIFASVWCLHLQNNPISIRLSQ